MNVEPAAVSNGSGRSLRIFGTHVADGPNTRDEVEPGARRPLWRGAGPVRGAISNGWTPKRPQASRGRDQDGVALAVVSGLATADGKQRSALNRYHEHPPRWSTANRRPLALSATIASSEPIEFVRTRQRSTRPRTSAAVPQAVLRHHRSRAAALRRHGRPRDRERGSARSTPALSR